MSICYDFVLELITVIKKGSLTYNMNKSAKRWTIEFESLLFNFIPSKNFRTAAHSASLV